MQMGLRNRDNLSSLFLFLFSVVVCVGSYGYSIGSLHKPGPGFFPLLGGLILGILSASHFLMAATKRRQGEGGRESVGPGKGWKHVVLPLVVLFAYPACLPVTGFALTTFGFMVVLLRSVEPVRWSTVLKLATGVTLLSYGVFQVWLKIQFPTGIFGI